MSSSRYASATPPSEHDGQLLSVGHQCSDPGCTLVDFLPFKCQHCTKPFCSEHFTPQAHKCDQYDATKHDRVAPSCPLCNTPVAIPPGEDPNVRMDRHINIECSVMTGKTTKKSSPVCARPRCGKLLFAPIQCNKCHQQFCPQHRYPTEHTCEAPAPSSTSKPSQQAAQRMANASQQTAAASNAAMAAIKRSLASGGSSSSGAKTKPTKPTPAPASSPSSKPTSNISNPFSKVDRTPVVSSSNPSSHMTIVTSASHDTTINTDDATAPPAHCSPKPLPASLSLLDSTRGFAPLPLFGTA